MNVILYSTDCPKCLTLEGKLNAAGIDYEVEKDIAVMRKKRFFEAPKLEVDGEVMDFSSAWKWVNNQMESK